MKNLETLKLKQKEALRKGEIRVIKYELRELSKVKKHLGKSIDIMRKQFASSLQLEIAYHNIDEKMKKKLNRLKELLI